MQLLDYNTLYIKLNVIKQNHLPNATPLNFTGPNTMFSSDEFVYAAQACLIQMLVRDTPPYGKPACTFQMKYLLTASYKTFHSSMCGVGDANHEITHPRHTVHSKYSNRLLKYTFCTSNQCFKSSLHDHA